MAPPQLTINSNPDSSDIEFLNERIYEFNVEATGIQDGQLLSIFIRDENGAILAGIYGWTWGGTCEIRYVWVHKDHRGKDWGSAMLMAAEQEARQRGCVQMILDTHSFQAPEFYRRLGFTIIGKRIDYPEGHQLYYLRKELSGDS
jgi:ribosomal protein S18 acetylase RimI-like enzyme